VGTRRGRHEGHGCHDPHLRRRAPARGEQPARDLIVTFFADEENGGVEGSQLVVRDRPEWFAGATEAISEVGGYSIPVGERRAYLLQVGRRRSSGCGCVLAAPPGTAAASTRTTP
jgi:acetylornithine deacetylase/succinyl-diaminopimelate desuccinylase-like protein